MRAAVLVSPGVLEIQDRAPLRPAENEAVVAVTLAGVCGTDLALFSGSYEAPLPLVPGHEFVGIVAEVHGRGDQHLVGRRVTAEINNSCVALCDPSPCAACMQGLETHCARRTVTGIISHDGAFSEQIAVPVGNLRLVPDEVSDEEAVFIEPFAAAIETFEMAPLEPDAKVVVLGGGRLGYLIAGVARARGAEVLVISRSEEKCARAEEWLGAQAYRLDSPDRAIARVRDWTDGLGASHVVEATGFSNDARYFRAIDPLAMAVEMTRPRGVIDLKSTPGDAMPCLPLTKIVVDEIRLQGSRCGPFDKAIDLIGQHPFPITALIDAQYPLSETAQAFARASLASKVVVRCQSSQE